MKKLLPVFILGAMGLSTSGCALLAAGGAGVMAHDEATEDDGGKFDPLEEHIDYDDDNGDDDNDD